MEHSKDCEDWIWKYPQHENKDVFETDCFCTCHSKKGFNRGLRKCEK
jgi:hypothetical protein